VPPEAVLAGLFGLLIGSFLNVCIHRWPRDLSVMRPRSSCPDCEQQIAWYDNIPLFSYVILRGRCRYCRAWISWRYPVVEALTGAAFFYFVWRAGGFTPVAMKWCVFSAILIALIFTDVETLLLPDEFTIGGLCAGLAISWFAPPPDSMIGRPFLDALIGAAVPSAALWVVGWLFEKLRHKEGLGFGDVKMIAMIGSFLGLRGALLSIALGAVVGAVAGLIWIAVMRKDAATYPLPFGMFLGIAALIAAAQGPRIMDWYAGALGF
jgi:leader peptidase (prepilin peptidase)/N-methyltransferase